MPAKFPIHEALLASVHVTDGSHGLARVMIGRDVATARAATFDETLQLAFIGMLSRIDDRLAELVAQGKAHAEANDALTRSVEDALRPMPKGQG